MRSHLLFLTLFAATRAYASQAPGALDPAFETIPFDHWLTEDTRSLFHWTAGVTRAELSFHQRLISHIEFEVDGRDLTERHHGELAFFIQIKDSNGIRYQTHGAVELSKLNENIKAATLQSDQRAFVLPGDYQLAVALLDTRTKDHAALVSRFKVSAPTSGLLSDAWHALPAIEFIHDQPSPESWYLPEINGHIQWATDVPASSRLNVLLTIAPTRTGMGTHHTPSDGLAALLPTLKFVSQTGSALFSQHVELLDLARHRAVFQTDEHELQWTLLKPALSEASTASIDVHSLSDSHRDAQFFVSEVRRVIRASEKPGVLVILSAPIAFESGEDLSPISLESLPACRVFYIRYHATAERTFNRFGPQMGRGPGARIAGPSMARNRPMQLNLVDQLEATLKPLKPKLFEVETPEEVTRALTEIRKALQN